jgi:hypothetical protein
MEPRALAAPRLPSRLALPTGSVVLAFGKDTTAANTREGKNQLSERATKEGTRKESTKELAKLGKRCAPFGVVVAVVGSIPERSPVTLPAPTSALRADVKL